MPNFLHKRTDTASKRPTAAQLDIGEIALNYDSATPGLFFEDDAGNVRKVGPTEVGTSAPNSSPGGSSGNSTGEMWVDTTGSNHLLKYYNGTSWNPVESNVNVDLGLTYDSNTVSFSKDVVQTPSSSITPSNNGDLVVEATSNTTLTFKLKGTDGTVRSGTITLS